MLTDTCNRKFTYLRLSLTEKCNFRCSYCLPDGYKGCGPKENLNINEITNLAAAFAGLGVRKIRLTGGEPTLRQDIVEVVGALKQVQGIETLALTTNGYRLQSILPDLKRAGLDAINISLDSLNPERFSKICGPKLFEKVKGAVDLSLEMGIDKVKTNTVIMRGINDCEFDDFLGFVRHRPISARFIELMRTNDNAEFFKNHHLSVETLMMRLEGAGWVRSARSSIGGPAVEFEQARFAGRIGMIAPYSKDFCSSCNRLRVSSAGALRLCLFGRGDYSLRHLLKRPDQKSELMHEVQSILGLKPISHQLHDNISGNMASLSAIGG